MTDKPKILVVDDDPGIRLAVTLKLRSAGFAVAEATDGVEALEYFDGASANLAVVDVGMPRMDGYSFCRELQRRADTRSIPVIILTAQDMEVPADVKPHLGRHQFLTKPFSPRELVKTVNDLLAPAPPRAES